MAEPGRTVRVSGLPADIEDDRLKDKLLIHFLRARNGGGEINSVTFVKATPVSALITFEDSRAAQRVIQRSRHILEVDDKNYKVIVTEHREGLDPDKVILSLTAAVDYRQLPGGIMALTSFHNSDPDIQINYDDTEALCTLHGAYSQVQAALTQLLGDPGSPQSVENKDSCHPATSGSRSVQIAQKPHTQESEDRGRKPSKQREQGESVHVVTPDGYNAGSHRDLTPGGNGLEDTGQREGAAAMQCPGHPTMSEEDFSLIVDSDMFHYMQKHCRKEYQHILSQYGVDVVDMTTQGLTTLYLQVAGVREDGRDQECLKLARKAISKLYEENETKICRGQLAKFILSPRGGLQRAMESLRVRHPKLLLNEDDQNINIIGSSSDVSEAKQFLLAHSDTRGKKEDLASLLRFPSYDSGSSTHADEQRVPLTMSSTVDSLNDGTFQLLRSEEDESRAEGTKRYKLAAKFKDSGLDALGSRPTDFTLRGFPSPSRRTRLGPMLGYDVLSETAEIAGGRASRASGLNTGGDILFKSGDALASTASMQNKTSLNSLFIDARPNSVTSTLSTTQSSLSGSTPLPPAGSAGSTLKRASSFSGTPQQKAQVMGQGSQDDSGKSAVRAKSSSFNNQTGKEKRDVFNAEIIVPKMMWQYTKDVYSTQVGDLTSDVQMKEKQAEDKRELTVTLRGANSSKVRSCQLGLQKLIDLVSVDFSMQELCFSELGITDAADETLKACCDEVHSRFKKVTIRTLTKSLFLLGSKHLCSQVCATLRHVFSGDSDQIAKQHELSNPSTSNWNPSTSTMNEDQSTSLHCSSNPQVMLESQTGKGERIGSSEERRTNHRSDFHETELVNGSISQPLVRKDPVIKEKVKIVGTVDIDGQKTFDSHSKTGNYRYVRHVNGVRSTKTNRTDKDMELHKKGRAIHSTQKDSSPQRPEIQGAPEESTSGLGGPGCTCVCGESEKSMLRTDKCGTTMCSKSLHVHCKVSQETERTPRGIQGTMTHSVQQSIPGYNKDPAIKISYCISDGIQGEGHPSPGKPFKGGIFEAFLPDCEKAKKLLPRLEEAFRQGLTFTVLDNGTGAMVSWGGIPHKTKLHGGKSGNSCPDFYLTQLSEVLTSHGIQESPAKS